MATLIENTEAVWNVSDEMGNPTCINTNINPHYLIQQVGGTSTTDILEVYFLGYSNQNYNGLPVDGQLSNGKPVFYYHTSTGNLAGLEQGCLLLKRDKTVWQLLGIAFDEGGGCARGKLRRFKPHKNVNVNKLILERGNGEELKKFATELNDEDVAYAANYNAIARVEYDRRKAQWQSKIAERDAVTDLRSRNNFDAYLREVCERINAFPICILFLDIDKFKQVNDEVGHDVGDLALRAVASQVTAFAYPNGQVFRYGGEEIVVILEMCHLTRAKEIAEHIRKVVATLPIPKNTGEFNVTVSIGVALASNVKDLDNAVKRADQAMNEAKKAGRNCVKENKSE